MKKHPLLSCLAALVLLALPAAAQTHAPTGFQDIERHASVVRDGFTKALVERAHAVGLTLQTAEAVSLVRDGVTVSLATPEGFERIAPRNLANGMDVGFGYIDAPGSGIPAGYYTLRARTPGAVALGKNEVQVELVDEDGNVAATRSGTAQVSSLDVPMTAARPLSQAGAELVFLDQVRIRIVICIRCPNGLILCFGIDIIF